MDIDKLVNLINAELKKDNTISVNKVCDKLQLKQSTVKSQLRNNNYKFNADLREYTKDILKHNIDIKEVIVEPKMDNIQRYNDSIDINKLQELITLLEPLKAIVEQYKQNDNIVEVNPIELKCKSITQVKQKLFKIDIDVLEQWEKFVLEHREYKVQQLISLALQEFINKYK